MKDYIFNLRVPPTEFFKYSNNYEYQSDEILKELSGSAKKKGYLTKEEFLKLCAWKTPRSKPQCAKNSEELIKEITNIAFSTNLEQLRIEILPILKGVGWPTASAILHFCHSEHYPILDFRALYSLGYEETPVYNYSFWNAYTLCCRELSKQYKCDMRAVDRALWQYSKHHQN